MTKYKCEQSRCQFTGCVIETASSVLDEDMLWCPIEDEAN